MKIINRNEINNHQHDDIIQCPKCYNFLILQEDDIQIKCQFCGYQMQYYTMKRNNTKLAQTIEILSNALTQVLEQNYGIIIIHNNKKLLIRNLNNQIYIEQIKEEIQNYQELKDKKIVKIS